MPDGPISEVSAWRRDRRGAATPIRPACATWPALAEDAEARVQTLEASPPAPRGRFVAAALLSGAGPAGDIFRRCEL